VVFNLDYAIVNQKKVSRVNQFMLDMNRLKALEAEICGSSDATQIGNLIVQAR
jgi:hypothetical protein